MKALSIGCCNPGDLLPLKDNSSIELFSLFSAGKLRIKSLRSRGLFIILLTFIRSIGTSAKCFLNNKSRFLIFDPPPEILIPDLKSEIDLIKAQASLNKSLKKDPRFRGTQDEAILQNYTPYIDKYASDRNKFDALDTRYLEAFKMIAEGKKIPTGTLEAFLFPIEKVLAGTEIGNKLNKLTSNY